MVGTAAGLHGDKTRVQIRQKRQQAKPPNTLAHHHTPEPIQAGNAANILSKIDTQRDDCHRKLLRFQIDPTAA
jgi:hypothetical protein